MNCPKCESQLKDNALFCNKCGYEIIQQNTPSDIYCSSDEKIILGLCGGLGHKFGISPWIIRIAFIVVTPFLFIYDISTPNLYYTWDTWTKRKNFN